MPRLLKTCALAPLKIVLPISEFCFYIFSVPIFATDRSRAVVRVLFLFYVALWFILRALRLLKSCLALCPCVFLFLLALWSLRLVRGKGVAGLCASRAFVCLLCTC